MTIIVNSETGNLSMIDPYWNIFDILDYLKNDCSYNIRSLVKETGNLLLFDGIDRHQGKAKVYINRTTKKVYFKY